MAEQRAGGREPKSDTAVRVRDRSGEKKREGRAAAAAVDSGTKLTARRVGAEERRRGAPQSEGRAAPELQQQLARAVAGSQLARATAALHAPRSADLGARQRPLTARPLLRATASKRAVAQGFSHRRR